MGDVTEGVVVHLAVPTLACEVEVWLPWLVTAMAMVDWLEMGMEGIARLTGEWAGMGLVTAV